MKKYIDYAKLSLLVSIALYLIGSFIRWDITWIKNIGVWEIHERVIIFMVYAAKEAFTILYYQSKN